MKRLGFFLLSIITMSSQIGFSQEHHPKESVNATESCTDVMVHNLLVNENQNLQDKDYKMESFFSGNIFPNVFKYIRLECKAGEEYEIRYVLGKHAKNYQMYVMAGQNEHILKSKQKLAKGSINIIKEHFRAKHDGVYVVFYNQKTKVENCVGFSVLKK